VGRPGSWPILFFIPSVHLIIALTVVNDPSKSFEKRVGFTIGLVFPGFIFFPTLGLGSGQDRGRRSRAAFGY
jgi:hypothetical protein